MNNRVRWLVGGACVILFVTGCVLARISGRAVNEIGGVGTDDPLAQTTAAPTDQPQASLTATGRPSLPAEGTLGPGARSSVASSMKYISLIDAESQGALCNDGSPAGYYLRRGVGSAANTWIIHLQGGGYCNGIDSCDERARQLPNLMTSKGTPDTRSGNGIQSPSPNDNSVFFEVTHVYIPYCSSDLWSGNRMGSPETGGRHFRGNVIFNSVIDQLRNPSVTAEPTLDQAERVILSGSSAGGVGALVQLDRLAEKLEGASVRGITDAGWIMDIEPLDPQVVPFIEDAQRGFEFWQAVVDDSCAASYQGQESHCYSGMYVYPELRTPLFVQIAQFDPPQLSYLGIDRPITQEEREYAEKFAARVRESLQPVDAAFSPRSRSHGILSDSGFWRITVQGTPLRVVVVNWFTGRDGPVKLIQQP